MPIPVPNMRRIQVVGAALCSLFTAIDLTFAQGTAFTYQGFLNDGSSPANGSYLNFQSE
jgi:hypothetical protein